MTDNTVNIGGPVPPRKIYQNPDAEAETLTIIGTAYKGPAFVPQQVVQQDNSDDIKNTFVGIFGDSEKNRYRNLKDEYDYHIDSQGFIASENWFQNGGDQVSYTRVLGIGTGIKDDDGLYIDSGFNVSNLISSGSIKRSGDNFYSNPFSVAGGHNGSLSFLIKEYQNKVVEAGVVDGFKNYLLELGVTDNTKKIISDVIISPSGVVPTIHEKNAPNELQVNFTSEITEIEYDEINELLSSKQSQLDFVSGSLYGSYRGKLNNLSFSENIYLYLNGYSNSVDSKSFSVIKIPETSERFTTNNLSYNEFMSKNYFSNRILEKGHLFYSTFKSNNSLKINDSTNTSYSTTILTTKKHSEISNNTNLPDYNDFTDKFRTAKTPWITSQPVNRVGIEDNREAIHEKVVKLFKIFAIDDGAVGNRYRIKIHPKEIFDKDDDKYSVFSLYIFEYSVINNTYTQVEEYIDLDLDPNSKNFIGRRIGTQYQYYDINKKRVYTVGDYPLISSHIRVLLSDEVNKSMIEKKCIPSGFESYPHINLNKESFSHYSAIDQAFYDSLGDIQQMPITYFPCFVYDHDMSSNDFNNTWGPLFFNIKELRYSDENDIINKQYYKNSDSQLTQLRQYEIKRNQYVRKNESEKITFSPHYFYTKYYQSNNNNTNKNVLVDEANWMNSFFHLEKIIYPVSKDDSNNRINDFPEAIYKRSGKVLDSNYLPDDLHEYYRYVNIDEVLNESKNENYTIDSRFLTFDLFTYGGFDGTNILDYDKKSLNNNAIARERFREDKEITSNSYIHAIDLSTKYENCLGDILLIPGIKEEKVVKKALVEIKEENRLLYCSDISGLTTSNEIAGSFYKTINEVNKNRNSSLIIDIEEDSEGIRTNPYRELVKTNFSNFSLFDRTNFESRSFVPLLGELIDEERKIVICPSVYVSGLMAKSIGEEMNSIDLQYTFGSELLDNENFKSVNKNFTINEKRFKKNGLNIIFEDNSPLSGTSTKLLTYNTTFGIRNSVYRQASTTRILNNIKKRLEYLLILGPRSILFDSASSINNIHQKVKYLINSVMEEIKDEGIIEDFSVVVPQDEYSNENSDVVENILRGKVYLRLSNTTKDNEDLNTISLGELNKEIKSLTNELENIRILSIK